MTTARPTPEAIAADIHATAQAHKAGVITDPEHKWRLDVAWLTASRLGLRDATVRALATIEGTLDVLLAAETADPEAVCGAVIALAGDETRFEVRPAGLSSTLANGVVISGRTLSALVRALRGGHRGA